MAIQPGARLTGSLNTVLLRQQINRDLAFVVQNTQKMFTDRVRQKFRENKTGSVSTKENGRRHQASAPGEAPAVDTGMLNKNIRTAYYRGGTMARIEFRRKYASWLEEGTTKMKPRPYAQVTLDEISGTFVDNIRKRLSYLSTQL